MKEIRLKRLTIAIDSLELQRKHAEEIEGQNELSPFKNGTGVSDYDMERE